MSVTKIQGIGGNREYHIANVLFAQPKKCIDKVSFQKYIAANNIDTIVNVSDYSISKAMCQYYRRCGIKNVVYAPFQDKILEPKEYKPLIKHIDKIYLETKSSGNMLIHCTAGINRSATVICYIVHLSTGLDMGYIIQKIRESNKTKREIDTLTNFTFHDLLKRFVAKY